jgi:rod shape-determining protein MreC
MKSGLEKQKNTKNVLYVFTAMVLISFSALFFSNRDVFGEVKDLGLSLFSGLRAGMHEASSAVNRTILAVQELSFLRREHSELRERIAR